MIWTRTPTEGSATQLRVLAACVMLAASGACADGLADGLADVPAAVPAFRKALLPERELPAPMTHEVAPKRLALRDAAGSLDALTIAWVERVPAPENAPEAGAQGLPQRLRFGIVLARTPRGGVPEASMAWRAWTPLDTSPAESGATGAALAGAPLLAFEVAGARLAAFERMSADCGAAGDTAAPEPTTALPSRALPAALLARMTEHVRAGIDILCSAPTSEQASQWLARSLTGVAPSDGGAGAVLDAGHIASSFDPLAVATAVVALDVRAAILAERGDANAAALAREDALWLLRQCGAPQFASRMAGSMPARPERDPEGRVVGVALAAFDPCFATQAWEIVDGVRRAQSARAADLVRMTALAKEVGDELRLDDAARKLLQDAFERIALALPAGVTLRAADLREVSERLVGRIGRPGREEAAQPGGGHGPMLHSELLTGAWEAWSRLAGDRAAMSPSERDRLGRQHEAALESVLQAAGQFVAADGGDVPGPIAARINERLADPWSPWARFPVDGDFIAEFRSRISDATARMAESGATAAELADWLEIEMLMSLASSWSERSAEGARIAPLPFEGFSIVSVSGEEFRPMIHPD